MELIRRVIEDDCGDTVNAALVCANPSWTLYESAFDWCCTPDQVGIALSDGECKPKGGAYSYYASTVSHYKYVSSSPSAYCNEVVLIFDKCQVTQLNAISPPSSWIGGVPSGLSNSMSAGAEATTNNPSATSPTQITGSTLSVVTTSQKATATTKSSSGAVIRPAFSIAVSGVALGGVFMVVALL